MRDEMLADPAPESGEVWCLYCRSPRARGNDAIVANAKVCLDCAGHVFGVGYDSDKAPLHVWVEGRERPRYEDEEWVSARARRPDGNPPKGNR